MVSLGTRNFLGFKETCTEPAGKRMSETLLLSAGLYLSSRVSVRVIIQYVKFWMGRIEIVVGFDYQSETDKGELRGWGFCQSIMY